MNKEKIEDFVQIWAETLGIKDKRVVSTIRGDIRRRCEKYESIYPEITVNEDYNPGYIIKPVNGKYSLEDFFLNRLMLGLRIVDAEGKTFEGTNGSYTGGEKLFDICIDEYLERIKDKATRHPGIRGNEIQIVKKTIEHEIGHCLKTIFSGGFKEHSIGLICGKEKDEAYKRLIQNLSTYKNGKYADKIVKIEDLEKEQEISKKIKTGIRYTGSLAEQNATVFDSGLEYLDELLNEDEALSLTESTAIH